MGSRGRRVPCANLSRGRRPSGPSQPSQKIDPSGRASFEEMSDRPDQTDHARPRDRTSGESSPRASYYPDFPERQGGVAHHTRAGFVCPTDHYGPAKTTSRPRIKLISRLAFRRWVRPHFSQRTLSSLSFLHWYITAERRDQKNCRKWREPTVASRQYSVKSAIGPDDAGEST
jgi:hypothetical protein